MYNECELMDPRQVYMGIVTCTNLHAQKHKHIKKLQRLSCDSLTV